MTFQFRDFTIPKVQKAEKAQAGKEVCRERGLEISLGFEFYLMANGESLQSVKQGTTMTRGGFSEE
jgi:hypothetical protein